MGEALNSVLKVEYVSRYSFRTPAEARIKIATWITDFYNTPRLHSVCGLQSPIDYAREYRGGLTQGLAAWRSSPRNEGDRQPRVEAATAQPQHGGDPWGAPATWSPGEPAGPLGPHLCQGREVGMTWGCAGLTEAGPAHRPGYAIPRPSCPTDTGTPGPGGQLRVVWMREASTRCNRVEADGLGHAQRHQGLRHRSVRFASPRGPVSPVPFGSRELDRYVRPARRSPIAG
ncbi:hypothetical protein [Streptomyces sp. NPDC014746]|uniref:hypothetical protein n=1 Tax=Streptomyces sp. NPDC014746 TaxID=3364904 RepID=UPI0036FA2199